MDIVKDSILTAQATIGKAHYQTVVKVDDHIIISDEPIGVGGMGTGVNPQGLFLASLGSCTAITLRMYIDRKMWAVEEVTVDVELFNINGEYLVEKQLHFKGDLNDDQKRRLAQIADACPIHKMLLKGMHIETEWS